jgi:hypothetical protein
MKTFCLLQIDNTKRVETQKRYEFMSFSRLSCGPWRPPGAQK